ncbi:MAG: Cof-type HAD-IIB family hydrolase [Muribaculaceae bacterium]|nr:Cof-type HAD-IIB family hydrolase [Muribaculaceae bacterium]
MARTLYITDLDGTLLNDAGQVSARSAEIISRLSREGVMISVATARTPATVVDLLRDTYTTADLVVMTGAGIWDRPGHRFRSLSLIPEEQVLRMLGVFRRRGLHPFCYTLSDGSHLDVYHAARSLNPSEALFVDQRKGLALKTFHLAESCPADATGRVVLFFGMGTKDDIVAVAEELREVTDCYVSYYKDTYTPDLWLLEIFAHGVSKANGVRHLRELVGADRVVAFGDNLNDIPMLREADVAVAVENALPEVKAVADVVIGSNDDDAVARFIAEDSAR